ncbi:MAG TPA: hypothetical protein VG944_00525 [Fimbriimonas sp.]|nr:hypothetical protein [Fimbriimonas sp.]
MPGPDHQRLKAQEQHPTFGSDFRFDLKQPQWPEDEVGEHLNEAAEKQGLQTQSQLSLRGRDANSDDKSDGHGHDPSERSQREGRDQRASADREFPDPEEGVHRNPRVRPIHLNGCNGALPLPRKRLIDVLRIDACFQGRSLDLAQRDLVSVLLLQLRRQKEELLRFRALEPLLKGKSIRLS